MAGADTNTEKRLAAEAAVAEIVDGMAVGLGTGSTAAFAIAALGLRVAAGLRVTVAATSLATERAAAAAGLVVTPFETLDRLDLAIDGADEIDPAFRAIKGGGGAMLREKIVADAADRMICIVDSSKWSTGWGHGPSRSRCCPSPAPSCSAGSPHSARMEPCAPGPMVRRR